MATVSAVSMPWYRSKISMPSAATSSVSLCSVTVLRNSTPRSWS
jgi:hypothetical protein